MTPARPPSPADRGAPDRFMWILPDRMLYVGLLGMPTRRSMGGVNVYVATDGAIRLRIEGGPWQTGELAVVPSYVAHEVAADARTIQVLQIEAETVDEAALPAPLNARGVVVDAPDFVARVRRSVRVVREQGRALDLAGTDFDMLFFGEPLTRRVVDPRIRGVIDAIRRDPSAATAAEDCAQAMHLSFSRFLHLFKQDVGAPFRSFRTWKRARSLLHHVNRGRNLAHVALDTGYPDSTHFSHSIRQIYGLKPSDIFKGSRRLAIYPSGAVAA